MEKVNVLDKLQTWMEKYVVPVSTKISTQRHLAAVRDGLMLLIPLTIIGGFAILLAMPPVDLSKITNSNVFFGFLIAWKTWANANIGTLLAPYSLTIGIVSVYVVCGVAYRLAKSYKMDGITNMLGALLIFLLMAGVPQTLVNATTQANVSAIPVGQLGATSMFAAILIALLVVEINHFFISKKIEIKLPDTVPPNVAAPFNVLISMIFSVVLFTILNMLCVKATGAGVTQLVFKVFQPFISASGSLPSILFINILMTTFWFFGIHGASMVAIVVTPITTMGLTMNAEAYAAGTQLPAIFAGSVNSVFGNWITYTAMLVLIFIIAKSAQLRSVAKVAIVPSMFNINEPSIFGLPTVLNLYTYIPLLICSIVNFSTAYLLMQANVIGRFFVTLPFTTPGPLAAWLATADWKTIPVWAVLFLVDMCILYPFIRAYDRVLVKAQEAK